MNIVAYGAGANSTAMIIGMAERKIPIDLILFSDTGAEHPHTYAFIDIFDKWLLNRGLPTITRVSYADKGGNRLTLEQECLNKNVLPSIAYGWKKCSDKHKIRPQEKFCNNYEPCRKVWAAGERINKYIGYDADENRRIQHAAMIDAADKKYIKNYPLFSWEWYRKDCAAIIEKAGLPHPGKSSCFFCPSMKKSEIQALWEHYPDLWERAVAMERAAAPSLTSIKGLGRQWSWESYRSAYEDIQRYEEMQLTLFDDFPEIAGGCLCSAPCGCYDG